MLVIELDPETAERLERLAREAGTTPASFALEAIREQIEEMEDVRIAQERLATPGRPYSAEEVKRELGL
jgi:predicted DNA-binding protein